MNIMKMLKNFISDMNVTLAKGFLYSQGRASQIFRDEFNAKLKSLAKHMPNISGSIDEDEEYHNIKRRLNEMLEVGLSRGNSTTEYSKYFTFDEIPGFVNNLIKKNRAGIEGYLGRGFLYENVMVWRNYHLPDSLQNYDVYSNVWHQDTHDGSRVLKLFLQLATVSKDDGPLRYLDESSTKKHWSNLRHRWDFDKMRKIPEFSEEKFFTG